MPAPQSPSPSPVVPQPNPSTVGASASRPAIARKALTIALLAVAGLFVGLLVVATIALSQLDRMRPWVNDKVSDATGRRFEVQGQLSGSWQWPLPREEGWRRWIPGVVVKADRLVMDNPAGFEPPFAGDTNKYMIAGGVAAPSVQS